jgi:predicted nucleic acid-binding Zn ribbon protein
MDDAQLRTVWQQRQFRDGATHLSLPLTFLMEKTLKKRVRQLSSLAEVWDDIIPESIRDHTALESFRGGVLTVIVDSAPHRFQLKTLLAAGLLKEIRDRFPAPLNTVRLTPGQFCSVDLAGDRRYEF